MIITKDILNEYFAGKATPLQKQFIENWVKEAGNEELFYRQLIEYETTHSAYSADLESAISHFQQFASGLEKESEAADLRIVPAAQKASQTSPIELGRNFLRWFYQPRLQWAVAATVVLLLTVIGWVSREQILFQTYATSYGKTRTVTLSDGSTVVLNANSSLRVPRFGFASNERRVHLTGEALFSVQHTATHQRFVVQTDNGFEVEVLGTVFDVFSRSRGGKVVLKEGKVNVLLTHQNVRKRVVLKPGQLVQIDRQKRLQLAQTTPDDHAAWRDHRYIFNETPVAEIAHLLQENYGLTLTATDKELLTLTVSGAFTASNADELLQLLETILGIKVTRQKNVVTISPSRERALL